MNELQQYYLGSLSERLVELEALRADLTESVSTETSSRLTTIAHRLKGTGASYGFDAISDRASELEEALGATPDASGGGASPATAVAESLDALMATIRQTVAAGSDA